jgi:hypothetical protein
MLTEIIKLMTEMLQFSAFNDYQEYLRLLLIASSTSIDRRLYDVFSCDVFSCCFGCANDDTVFFVFGCSTESFILKFRSFRFTTEGRCTPQM